MIAEIKKKIQEQRQKRLDQAKKLGKRTYLPLFF